MIYKYVIDFSKKSDSTFVHASAKIIKQTLTTQGVKKKDWLCYYECNGKKLFLQETKAKINIQL